MINNRNSITNDILYDILSRAIINQINDKKYLKIFLMKLLLDFILVVLLIFVLNG